MSSIDLKSYKFTLRNSNLSPRIFGILMGLLVWSLIASVFPNELMPYPTEALFLAWELVETGVAWTHLNATISRTILGFAGSMLVGSLVGVVMGINNYGEKFGTPWVIIGLSIPAVAWAAITVLIFGFDILSPVTATVLTTFPYVAINVWKGVENLEADLLSMSFAFKISNARMLTRLILPSTAPFLFSAFRFGLAISWKIVTIAEIFAANSGVGYRLWQSYQLYKFEEAWAWAILFLVVILLVEYLITKPIERRVFAYRRDANFDLIG